MEGAGGGFGLLSCLYRGVPGGFLFSSVHDDDGVYTPACMVRQFQAEIFRTRFSQLSGCDQHWWHTVQCTFADDKFDNHNKMLNFISDRLHLQFKEKIRYAFSFTFNH